MTEAQLHLAIGVPALFSAAMTAMLIAYINSKTDALQKRIDARLDAINALTT